MRSLMPCFDAQFRAKGDVDVEAVDGADAIFEIECNLDGLTQAESASGRTLRPWQRAQRASAGKEYVAVVEGQSVMITDLRYSEKDGIVAVTLNRSTRIYLFALDMTNALKPRLRALHDFNAMERVREFNGFYGMHFDDNGNLMVLLCGKREGVIHLILDVFAVSKSEDGGVSVQSAKDNVVVGMVRKQIVETSMKMDNVAVHPLFFSLLRDWKLGGYTGQSEDEKTESDRVNKKSLKSNADAHDTELVAGPPPSKKYKLDPDGAETVSV